MSFRSLPPVTSFTSIISQGDPIPDPPESRYLVMIISAVCVVALLGLIVFVVVEFSMDMAGHPIEFVPSDLPESEGNAEDALPGPLSLNDIQARFSLLSPANETRVKDGKVFLLCTWRPVPGRPGPPVTMQLLVDESPEAWDMQFGSNTWTASLELPPGVHNLRCSGFEVNVFVEASGEAGTPSSQDHRPLFHAHPDIDDTQRCFDCHHKIEGPDDLVRRGRNWTLGVWKGSATCFDCHDHQVDDFEKSHGHLLEPIEDCHLCHAVHGTASSEPALLKAPRSVLCAQCHEAP